jgi:4-amino-4-deoxy-L-arabinose transferase-like glycosyltransferase
MISPETRLARGTAVTVAALVVLRLVAAAVTQLTFDEAYYWTWAKHLAGGYYDHPPMVAVVIRLGTLIAGDTAFGVRLVSILLALPMSWAVYRAARILFDDVKIAAAATIFLNATLMASVGTTIVTPDAPLMVASCFVLYCLAKVWQTGRGVWWLAVGAAAGFGLLSKYTALFFGVQILLWLVLVKDQRRWLASPWLYLGGIVAVVIFSPVIFWNADHQWVSFIKQIGRARVEGMTLKYLGEMIPTQFVFATPSVFILGVFGLYALMRARAAHAAGATLVNISVWMIFLYFVWHSLHARVEANWLGPVYPAFAIAAAYAAWGTTWNPREQRTMNWSRRLALPIGVALFVGLIVQANTGLLTGFRRDATVRSVGVGWPALAGEIEAIRIKQNATCVLAADYGTTSWLMFYLPKGTCVSQFQQRYRWTFMNEPDANLLKRKALLIGPAGASSLYRARYARVENLAELTRKRSGVAIETYAVDLLDGATGEVLDHALPPELGGPR